MLCLADCDRGTWNLCGVEQCSAVAAVLSVYYQNLGTFGVYPGILRIDLKNDA